MANHNEELIGKFCLYQRPGETIHHIALPYAPHPGIPDQKQLSVIFLDTNAPYREGVSKEEILNQRSLKVDHGVDTDSLTPIDLSTIRGRTIAQELLRGLAELVAEATK